MNGDRELLELVAKAAGIELRYWEEPAGEAGYFVGTKMPGRDHHPWRWNPLEDDGDALRLAAMLNLHEAIRVAHRLVGKTVDIYAATRRSIVRAAAEIPIRAKDTP